MPVPSLLPLLWASLLDRMAVRINQIDRAGFELHPQRLIVRENSLAPEYFLLLPNLVVVPDIVHHPTSII